MTEIMFTGRNSCKGINIDNLQVWTVWDMYLVLNIYIYISDMNSLAVSDFK